MKGNGWLLSLLCVLMLSGCYQSNRGRFGHRELPVPALAQGDSVYVMDHEDSVRWQRKQDSLRFLRSHHYTENFNFVVRADSLPLLQQQPEEAVSMMLTDTFYVYRHDHLVVADIRVMPTDSIDSVWVSVARDQLTFGWIHESELLKAVDPDDPISQFITTFSDSHVLIFLIVLTIIGFAYVVRRAQKRKARMVHFNDIASVYPTLLALIVASSATLYASIQMFAPEVWRHFYFNPTLNPFSAPPVIAAFLVLVWAMLIISLAAAEMVRVSLTFDEAVFYGLSLIGICFINYIVFSITTLYYIGYVLLVAYFWFALRRYWQRSLSRYSCGHCGAPMHDKGRCPHCGALNE